jgi:hypothetical protein
MRLTPISHACVRPENSCWIERQERHRRGHRIAKGRSRPGGRDPAHFRRRLVEKNKCRSNRPAAHLKRGRERVEIGAPAPNSTTHNASYLGQRVVAQTERGTRQSVVVKRLPSKGPRGSIRSVRFRSPKSNPSTKPDAAKPAIALAGPAGARIVVVPAEQVRREREQALQRRVPRPRVRGAGLTGRLAFEALFK